MHNIEPWILEQSQLKLMKAGAYWKQDFHFPGILDSSKFNETVLFDIWTRLNIHIIVIPFQ